MTWRVLNVLSAMIATAGCSSSLLAQIIIQPALVFDNDPRLAAIGVNYGTASLLPGVGATAVGITLIARATTFGTMANYGVLAMGGGGAAPPVSSGVTIFYHNDLISNQTSPLWSSPALAFQRGVSGANAQFAEPRPYELCGSSGPAAQLSSHPQRRKRGSKQRECQRLGSAAHQHPVQPSDRRVGEHTRERMGRCSRGRWIPEYTGICCDPVRHGPTRSRP